MQEVRSGEVPAAATQRGEPMTGQFTYCLRQKLLFACATVVLLLCGAATASAATFTVNSTGDSATQANCTDHVNDCTLRGAIMAANAVPGADTIRFGLPPTTTFYSIRPETPLPQVTDTVTIHGFTMDNGQPFPAIALDGRLLPSTSTRPALDFGYAADDSKVLGISILKFPRQGINAQGGMSGLIVRGCFIGTNKRGTSCDSGDSGNGYAGIQLEGSDAIIGGGTLRARNVISCNGRNGVRMTGANSHGNRVFNNFIGTDRTGKVDLGNAKNGVAIVGGSYGNVVRAGNVISGNDQNGILIEDSRPSAKAANNIVRHNLIGTTASGLKPLGNTRSGVYILNSTRNRIGGSAAKTGNVISANGLDGVYIRGSSAKNNVVRDNYIGTTKDGKDPLPNGEDGIELFGASHNWIGGVITSIDHAGLSPGNLVAYNTRHGLLLTTNASSNIVRGNNLMGNGVYGVRIYKSHTNLLERNSVWGNAGHGIQLKGDANANKIIANDVEDNGGDGLRLVSGVNNPILNSTFYGNKYLGINLVGGTENSYGVTANDYKDPDPGPNLLQNYPRLFKAVADSTGGTVKGKLNSRPYKKYRLQFFGNNHCDPSGFGEGQRVLGSKVVQTNGDGNAYFEFHFDGSVSPGKFVTATATRLEGSELTPTNTSEFSKCEKVELPTVLKVTKGDIHGKIDFEGNPVAVMDFRVKNVSPRKVSLLKFQLKAGGNGDDKSDIEKVKLFKKTGSGWAYVDSAQYYRDNGKLWLEFDPSLRLDPRQSKSFKVKYVFADKACMFASLDKLDIGAGQAQYATAGPSGDSDLPLPIGLALLFGLAVPAILMSRRRLRTAAITVVFAAGMLTLYGCVEEDPTTPDGMSQQMRGGPAVHTYNVKLVDMKAKFTSSKKYVARSQIEGLPVEGAVVHIRPGDECDGSSYDGGDDWDDFEFEWSWVDEFEFSWP